MAVKTGIGYLDQNLNSNKNLSDLLSRIENLELKMVHARVTDIILDESHPKFSEYGGWNGIGIIEWEIINNQSPKSNIKPFARPFFPQFKTYPLVNELIVLIKSPDTNIGSQDTSESYYYLNTISLWNHPHHNAYPNIFDEVENEKQKTDYQAIEGGSVRRVEDESTEINLQGDNPSGGTFVEKPNIHPILPFVGDNIFEGRFGNSIRLGSTTKSKGLYKNNWSDKGDDNNPITILRNGQPLDAGNEGWLPIVENINKDLSSIYLTSDQIIPITASCINYTGLEEEPDYPNVYEGAQVILNSERVLLNSTKDSVLISGQKVVSLSANEGIGLSTSGSMSIESGELKLGASSAEQPIILGDTFLTSLNGVLEGLKGVMDALSGEPSLQVTPALAQTLSKTIGKYQEKIEDFTSKTVKSI